MWQSVLVIAKLVKDQLCFAVVDRSGEHRSKNDVGRHKRHFRINVDRLADLGLNPGEAFEDGLAHFEENTGKLQFGEHLIDHGVLSLPDIAADRKDLIADQPVQRGGGQVAFRVIINFGLHHVRDRFRAIDH